MITLEFKRRRERRIIVYVIRSLVTGQTAAAKNNYAPRRERSETCRREWAVSPLTGQKNTIRYANRAKEVAGGGATY